MTGPAWLSTTLGDCCDIVSGATPSTTDPSLWDGEVEWATPKDLSLLDGNFIGRTGRRISQRGLESCAAAVLPAQSVLFSSRAPIGLVAINTVPMATNQGFKSLVPKRGVVDATFLYHWLRAHRAYLEGLGNGATFKELSKAVVSRVEIRLPPFAEQRRIADILDKADAVRRKRKEAIALTEELLRSAFLDMFGDPVTNPKGWPVKLLGDTTELFAGNSLPSGEPFVGQPNGVLLLKVGDMNLPGNEVYVAASREWARNALGGIVAPAGSVIFPKRGGAIATNKKRVLMRPAALDPNLMAVAPAGSLSLSYLQQWFEMFDLTSLSSGSAVPQLNKKDLSPLRIPVPPETAQASFARVTLRVAELRRRAGRALLLTERLFSGLVQRAFRGELRVA